MSNEEQSHRSRVFVSHSSRDKEVANQIVDHLETNGIPCWIAPRDITPGAEYNAQITSGIRDCLAVLLVESAHSSASEQVIREIDSAASQRISVIPVRIEEYPRSEAFEHLLRTYQWVDASSSTIERHLDEILNGVRRALGEKPPNKRRDPNAIPDYIGPYRILKVLGEGGMGTVYQAEQRKPIRRMVALKRIKPGLDSKEILARFETERQALARMDHPNIAKVLDVGADEFGRPFFVMEYVPGKSIVEYADENRLSIEKRLKLFVQVCQAISHAHTKAIIHRDVKSGNVLAFTSENEPAVKVIDFGIAKALTADRLTDRSYATAHGFAVGTYEYMSPEQADGSADIDTRSDVYSLGVLLYELLVGFKPFDADTFANLADAEARKVIKEIEPAKPSTKLTSRDEAGSKAAMARSTKVDALASKLRSELEWIPLKAMRKERERRYESPLDLAEDIENYLAGRPLKAGPESSVYRLRKTLERNLIPCLASAVVLIAMAAGIAFYIYSINSEKDKTEDALNLAKQETKRAEKNAGLIQEKVLEIEQSKAAFSLATAKDFAAMSSQLSQLGKTGEAHKFLLKSFVLGAEATEFQNAVARHAYQELTNHGQQTYPTLHFQMPISIVKVSADGSTGAIVLSKEDSVRIIDLRGSFAPMKIDYSSPIQCCALSNEGDFILTGHKNGSVVLTDRASKKQKKLKPKDPRKWIDCRHVAIGNDGVLIASSGHIISKWARTGNGTAEESTTLPFRVASIITSSATDHIAVFGRNSIVKLSFDNARPNLKGAYVYLLGSDLKTKLKLINDNWLEYPVSFDPSGEFLITHRANPGQLNSWDLQSGENVGSLGSPRLNKDNLSDEARFATGTGNQFIAYLSNRHRIFLYDFVGQSSDYNTFEWSTDSEISCLDWSDTSATLAVGTTSGTVTFLTSSQVVQNRFVAANLGRSSTSRPVVTRTKLEPSTGILGVVMGGRSILVFDPQEKKVVSPFIDFESSVQAFTFVGNQKNHLLVVLNNGSIQRWDWSRGKLIQTLKEPETEFTYGNVRLIENANSSRVGVISDLFGGDLKWPNTRKFHLVDMQEGNLVDLPTLLSEAVINVFIARDQVLFAIGGENDELAIYRFDNADSKHELLKTYPAESRRGWRFEKETLLTSGEKTIDLRGSGVIKEKSGILSKDQRYRVYWETDSNQLCDVFVSDTQTGTFAKAWSGIAEHVGAKYFDSNQKVLIAMSFVGGAEQTEFIVVDLATKQTICGPHRVDSVMHRIAPSQNEDQIIALEDRGRWAEIYQIAADCSQRVPLVSNSYNNDDGDFLNLPNGEVLFFGPGLFRWIPINRKIENRRTMEVCSGFEAGQGSQPKPILESRLDQVAENAPFPQKRPESMETDCRIVHARVARMFNTLAAGHYLENDSKRSRLISKIEKEISLHEASKADEFDRAIDHIRLADAIGLIEPQDALENLNQAEELLAKSPISIKQKSLEFRSTVHVKKGRWYRNQGNSIKAIEEFTKGLMLSAEIRNERVRDQKNLDLQREILWATFDLDDQKQLAVATAESQAILARNLLRRSKLDLAGELAICGLVLIKYKAWPQAEKIVGEALQIRQALAKDNWTTFNTQSMYGEILMKQGNTEKAEKELLDGYLGMKKRIRDIPKSAYSRLAEAVNRLDQLSEKTMKKIGELDWKKEAELWREN